MITSLRTSDRLQAILVDLLRLRGETGGEAPCISSFLAMSYASAFGAPVEPSLYAAMAADTIHYATTPQGKNAQDAVDGLAAARNLLTQMENEHAQRENLLALVS